MTITDEASEALGEPVTVTVQGKATGSPSAVTVYMIPQPPSESTASSESPSSGKKSTPVGAIVGGVVGGVAFLGLIGLGVFLLLRCRRKNKHQGGIEPTSQPNTAPPMSHNQYPYHRQHQGAVPPYTDVSMVSSPLDARMSMMTGSVSPSVNTYMEEGDNYRLQLFRAQLQLTKWREAKLVSLSQSMRWVVIHQGESSSGARGHRTALKAASLL